MTTTRTRLASVVGAGALVLALGACSDDSGDAGSPTSAASTSAQATVPEVAEGEEVDIAEFVAMMKSPGEEKLSSYTMTMNMKTGGEDLTMEGAVDVSGEDPALDLDMTVPGAGKMQMRMVDGRLFMAMPGITPEGKFMEIPPEQLGDTASALEQVDVTSQMDSWEQAARKVVYVGEEDVDGTTMRHYSVTVDSAAAMDAAGVTGDDAAAASAAMGDDFVYEVWLDDDNLMRKLAFDMEGTVTEMFADNWGEPQDIQAPPAEDIVDGFGGDTDADSETSDG